MHDKERDKLHKMIGESCLKKSMANELHSMVDDFLDVDYENNSPEYKKIRENEFKSHRFQHVTLKTSGIEKKYGDVDKVVDKIQSDLRLILDKSVNLSRAEKKNIENTEAGISRAVILTALRVEYCAVRLHLTELEEYKHPQGDVYEKGKFSCSNSMWDVGIVEIGAGNQTAAMEAERAISYFKPEVVFFVGVAGGLKDVKIGDVVAATKVYGYESGKATETFKTRPEVGNSAHPLIQRARAEARKTDWIQRFGNELQESYPQVFVGAIAAGEKVIASTLSNVYSLLKQNYGDSLAIEMEGIGFLKAIHANPQVNAIIIRGISDLVDGKSDADAGGSQEIAARNASAFAFEILAKL